MKVSACLISKEGDFTSLSAFCFCNVLLWLMVLYLCAKASQLCCQKLFCYYNVTGYRITSMKKTHIYERITSIPKIQSCLYYICATSIKCFESRYRGIPDCYSVIPQPLCRKCSCESESF